PIYRTSITQESRDLAVFDNVDTEPVCGSRVAPGNRVMAYGAGSRLEQPAVNGEAAGAGVIEEWQEALHARAIEELAVDAVEPHDVALAGQDVELRGAVRQYELAALRKHDVEVELVGKSFP